MEKKFVEILAPAGSAECVKAAVRCGANAVYLGMKDFNARRNADNFGFEELKETVKYCHSHGVKVHVTFNTLVSDDEIAAATDFIRHVCRAGADVLILQDIGLALLAGYTAPEIERHASTQMSVQTAAGINLLEKMGYSLAVLPRELTKQEIIEIKKNTSLKLEAFVHGALCMCVSGQCYLSSMLGGRSGNRGLCAQPCRLNFSANGVGGFDLSLKDLSLVKHASELCSLGISSLKIEGRMKRPEYVAAAVTATKAAVENLPNKEIEAALSGVFSRSGFTDGYYQNERGKAMFGTRRKEDVLAADNKLLSSLARLYDKEQPTVAVDFCLSVFENEKVSLSASARGKSCFVFEDYIPEKALNKPSTEEGLKERLSKCGGTMFFARNVEIELDEGLIVPASVINSLRRRALEELEKLLSDVKEKRFTPGKVKVMPHRAEGELKFHVRVEEISKAPQNLSNVENLYLPLNIEEKDVEKFKNSGVLVAVEIPRGLFGKEKDVEKQLERVKSFGINDAYCSTLDAVAIAKKAQMNIHTGFAMNVFNSLSATWLEAFGVKSLTLSPELTLQKASKIGSRAKRGLVAYGRLPLMLTRNCPIKNVTTCSRCQKGSFLKDRMGIEFPVTCNGGCSEILNSRPIYMADRLDEIKNMDFALLYFTKESAKEADRILQAYREKRSPEGEFTRGLYYREIQ